MLIKVKIVLEIIDDVNIFNGKKVVYRNYMEIIKEIMYLWVISLLYLRWIWMVRNWFVFRVMILKNEVEENKILESENVVYME